MMTPGTVPGRVFAVQGQWTVAALAAPPVREAGRTDFSDVLEEVATSETTAVAAEERDGDTPAPAATAGAEGFIAVAPPPVLSPPSPGAPGAVRVGISEPPARLNSDGPTAPDPAPFAPGVPSNATQFPLPAAHRANFLGSVGTQPAVAGEPHIVNPGGPIPFTMFPPGPGQGGVPTTTTSVPLQAGVPEGAAAPRLASGNIRLDPHVDSPAATGTTNRSSVPGPAAIDVSTGLQSALSADPGGFAVTTAEAMSPVAAAGIALTGTAGPGRPRFPPGEAKPSGPANGGKPVASGILTGRSPNPAADTDLSRRARAAYRAGLAGTEPGAVPHRPAQGTTPGSAVAPEISASAAGSGPVADLVASLSPKVARAALTETGDGRDIPQNPDGDVPGPTPVLPPAANGTQPSLPALYEALPFWVPEAAVALSGPFPGDEGAFPAAVTSVSGLAQPLSQASVLAPVPVAQIAPMAIAIATDPGTGAIEVALSPDELGRLHMQVTTEGNILRIAMTVERPDTLDLLRRHSDQLLADLRQAGFGGATLSFGQGTAGDGRTAATPPPEPAPPSAEAPGPDAAPRHAMPRGQATENAPLDLRL